jgi:uncharacterized membrane protein
MMLASASGSLLITYVARALVTTFASIAFVPLYLFGVFDPWLSFDGGSLIAAGLFAATGYNTGVGLVVLFRRLNKARRQPRALPPRRLVLSVGLIALGAAAFAVSFYLRPPSSDDDLTGGVQFIVIALTYAYLAGLVAAVTSVFLLDRLYERHTPSAK